MTAAGACGCCAGVAERTPLTVQNRPGLSAIAYRIGTHPDFRASMIAALSDPAKQRLAELSTRDPGDFSIALLDAWATAADVLTFYTERLAQESYLRTARDRVSLQELGRLVGYRLRPGVAAETHVAFALEAPPSAPPQALRDPGALPPVTPEAVTLEVGLRVQSIPGPGERPQTFETVEEIEARPEWNAVPASKTVRYVPGLGARHAYLEGTPNLKPGDTLLLKGADVLAEGWDVRTLTTVLAEPTDDPAHARTRVEWAEPLGSFNPLVHPDASEVYVLRKRLNVFGHNAPLWRSMSDAFRDDYWEDDPDRSDWPLFTISPAEGFTVDLDGSQPDVVTGSWVVLSEPHYRELWRVHSATELSRAEFAVSGKVTRLTLEGGENYSFFETPRETTVFAVSEPLALAEAPDASPVEGDSIAVKADLSLLPKGRTLIVAGITTAGEKHAETAVLAHVEQTAGGWRLPLEDDLQQPYERASVVVHANVALATHGETVKQLLGSGRAAASFQRFELAPGAPLTYVQSRGASGVDSALEVRVNEVRWDEVATLFEAGPKNRAYVLGTDTDGKAYVEFGDGKRGSRLPSGQNNVRARYRKGLGAAGNVKAGALAQLLDRPLGVKGASNPVQAAGGVDPEPESEARASIPLAVRTLGRAVSLLDYADFARAFSGISKAHAAVLPLRTGRTVVVTVALEGDPGPEAAERLGDLGDALRSHGDPQVAVVVLQGHEETVRLALRIGVDPAYDADAVLAAVASALEDEYAREVREFVQPLYRSEIVASVHRVAGVVALDVDEMYTQGQHVHDRLLARQPSIGASGVAVSAGLLKLDAFPFDSLQVMT